MSNVALAALIVSGLLVMVCMMISFSKTDDYVKLERELNRQLSRLSKDVDKITERMDELSHILYERDILHRETDTGRYALPIVKRRKKPRHKANGEGIA